MAASSTHTHETQQTSDEPARNPPRHALAGPAGGIMALQRAAGNQAVSALLEPRASLPAEPQHAPAPAQAGIRGGGLPLDPATQTDMEARFGHNLGAVRVHADTQAAESATAVRAKAYTVGHDVVFGAGRYAPESSTGKQLLAHELAHVVQQSRGGAPAPQLNPNAPHEQEAAQVADAFADGSPVPTITQGTSVGIACQPLGEDMTSAHAGGAMGERDAAFVLGQRGFDVVIGPGGPGGHQLTAPGLDILAYNPNTDMIWVVDNKASGGTSTVQSASAITRNLSTNLNTALAHVQGLPDFPNKARIVQHLENSLDALGRANPLPGNVRLVVTNAGGYHSDVSASLRRQNIAFEDFTGASVRQARKQDIANAKAAGTPPGRPVTRTTVPAPNRAIPVPSPSDVDAPAATPVSSPRVNTGSRAATAVAAGGAVIGTFALPFINAKLQEHFAEYRAEGARELTDQAIAKANPEFLKVIERNRREIEAAHAQGRMVYLYVTIQTAYTDTTDRDPIVGSGLSIGDVAYVANIKDVQIVYEGGKPKPYIPNTNWAGDLFRDIVGVTVRYSHRSYPIEGTDLAARRRNEIIKEVEASIGDPAVEFEALIVKSQYAGLPKDSLREYAKYKRQATATEPAPSELQRRKTAEYWGRMETLVDAPIEQVITHAKVKSVPLDELLAHAIRARDEAGQSGDHGAGAQAHAYWSEVIRLINAPLDERFTADRQRFRWKQGPSKEDRSKQQAVVDSLEKRKAELEQRLAEMNTTDARTQTERDAGEPPHPPWSRMWEMKKQIATLREDIAVEKRLLKDFNKK